MCEGVLFAGLTAGLIIGTLITYGFLTMRHPFVSENVLLQKRIEELESLMRKEK